MSPPHDLLAGYIPSDAPAADSIRTLILLFLYYYIYIFRSASAKGLQAAAAAVSQARAASTIFRESIKNEFGRVASSDRADIYRVNCTPRSSPSETPHPPPQENRVRFIELAVFGISNFPRALARPRYSALHSIPVPLGPPSGPKPFLRLCVTYIYVRTAHLSGNLFGFARTTNTHSVARRYIYIYTHLFII